MYGGKIYFEYDQKNGFILNCFQESCGWDFYQRIMPRNSFQAPNLVQTDVVCLQAIINSTITPSMTFTKTSQKFGQWSDPRANTVYGLGFGTESDLSKVRYHRPMAIILFFLSRFEIRALSLRHNSGSVAVWKNLMINFILNLTLITCKIV